jgi:hypothetical protein
MKPPIKTYKQLDVVIVPFPFTDRLATKRRPALVCQGCFTSIDSIALIFRNK